MLQYRGSPGILQYRGCERMWPNGMVFIQRGRETCGERRERGVRQEGSRLCWAVIGPRQERQDGGAWATAAAEHAPPPCPPPRLLVALARLYAALRAGQGICSPPVPGAASTGSVAAVTAPPHHTATHIPCCTRVNRRGALSHPAKHLPRKLLHNTIDWPEHAGRWAHLNGVRRVGNATNDQQLVLCRHAWHRGGRSMSWVRCDASPESVWRSS